MEFPMQCRLCLSSGPAEAFVSILGNPQPHLAESISSCCQLQVKKDDKLPDTICRSCNDNLELLISFRKVCHHSDEISKLKLSQLVDIKPEEVLLDDLLWENEADVNTPPNVNNIHGVNVWWKDQTKEKLYKCDICFKTFAERKYLRRHVNGHTGLKPYKCEICFKSFARKVYLTGHIKIHTGLKSHKCDICSKPFTQKSNLTIHKRTHTGLKPYKCDICSKSFAQNSNLTKHKISHTQEKRYQCDICLKLFTQKSNLTKHKKISCC
ncbi:uncharacterized protein LOC143921499 [Arctopsyche grandis]|uniref:uncharacterized protein LOC143921499 n=1 Tax=Arctopsyche grandis TaxID=121162 RepID=UPI00406D85F3